jgi:hypothetical protein
MEAVSQAVRHFGFHFLFGERHRLAYHLLLRRKITLKLAPS